jgi:homoserine O-succinyltransferase/O-acetyltransferase
MPVLMEQGSCGRSFTLLPGVRCTPARAPLRGGIEIGIVNNMPDAALEATERQFISLLAAASEKMPLRVRLFALPGVPRGESARRYLASHYAGIAGLWNTRLDGLIVTGTEPRCPDFSQEPYWPAFTELVDWAKRNTVSTIWSCLGAHAAARHLDGVERRPFADKCFGVFRCERTRHHALTTPDAGPAEVPHSRWNGVSDDALAACGYDILSRSGEIGPDIFVKEFHSLFVFLQGHPEYEPTTLLREYRRDVGRFLRRERQNYPQAPWRYFDKASTLALEMFRASALANPSEELLESFPAAVAQDHIVNSWRRSAVALYRNWLGTISTRRQASARTVAAHRGELARSP